MPKMGRRARAIPDEFILSARTSCRERSSPKRSSSGWWVFFVVRMTADLNLRDSRRASKSPGADSTSSDEVTAGQPSHMRGLTMRRQMIVPAS